MARAGRDYTIEEYDAYTAAQRDQKRTQEATAEEGGPRVTMVPVPTSVPIDFLPDDVVAAPTPPPSGLHAVPFEPEPSRKVGGWSAARQRIFIEARLGERRLLEAHILWHGEDIAGGDA